MISKMCIKLHRNLRCFFVFNKKIAQSDMIQTELLSVFIFTSYSTKLPLVKEVQYYFTFATPKAK
jgi:hypothetical protein